ncbi:hypothetical protein JCM6882_005130 [Rhodosporidiobolus microsporus]
MASLAHPVLQLAPPPAQPAPLLSTDSQGRSSIRHPIAGPSTVASTGAPRSEAEQAPASTTSPIVDSSTLPQPDVPAHWLDKERLLEIKSELDGSEPLSQDVLFHQAKSLVHHGLLADQLLAKAHLLYKDKLSKAQAAITRLETDLSILPGLDTSASSFDFDRVQSENQQLRTDAAILARKLAKTRELLYKERAGARANRSIKGKERAADGDLGEDEDLGDTATEIASDEDDGDAEKADALQAENRALKVDVQRLEDQVRTSSDFARRLEAELGSLRAHILSSIGYIDVDPPQRALPSPPTSQEEQQHSSSSSALHRPNASSSHKISVFSAKAESELLLHAGRVVVSHSRPVGPDGRAGDARVRSGAGLGLSSDSAAIPSTSSSGLTRQATHDDGFDGLLQLANASAAGASSSAPSYGTSSGHEGIGARTSTSRRRRNSSMNGVEEEEHVGWAPPPAPTVGSAKPTSAGRNGSGGGGAVYYSDAKASYAEGVGGELEQPDFGAGTRSSSRRKRSRPSAAMNAGDSDEEGEDSDYYPSPPPVSLSFPATSSISADPSPALRRASTSSSSNSHGKSGGGGRPLGQTLSALDVLAQASSSAAQAVGASSSASSRKKPKFEADDDYDGGEGGGFGGPGGPPAKKARLPYTKWNVQEDEMLLKAVIQCGCAWDSVAKLCPTRAYHQVRQRFLRGLRSGETVPPELAHLQPAVLKSVADYEAKKKRKKLAKQQAEQLARAAVEDF